MKLPKTKRMYCKYCNKHTEHKIIQTKAGQKRGTLRHGSIQRAAKRGLGTGFGNKNRWGSKPSSPKRTGSKVSKKTNLKFKCNECNKQQIQKKGFRAKKIELV